ncbi:MAG: FAD-dependent thymidylate synthase [Dehalococcoidia bacterium]|nr:FAD-dependent thymidylate synthase [Dehalococcoidia bacterium]
MIGEREVLDLGYVRLIDVMGDDWEPARAARTSYDQPLKGEEADTKLMRYLLRNRHTTPFEMVELKWEMKLPIFVARQIIRHRTANVNEMSGRYTEMPDEHYVPEEWRAQDTKNKQGSVAGGLDLTHQGAASAVYDFANKQAYDAYQSLLGIGVAREMARMILPLSMYTKWIWKLDLHNTLHFLELRLDSHATSETQQYARAMNALMRGVLPQTMKLWDEIRQERMWAEKLFAGKQAIKEAAELLDVLVASDRDVTEETKDVWREQLARVSALLIAPEVPQ